MKKKQNISQKKVTSLDVARTAKCSQSSVSKVMNDQPHVSGYLRRRILAAVRELDYNMDPHGKLRRVALIIPKKISAQDTYTRELINAMIYILADRKIRMEFVLDNDLDALQGQTISGGISISLSISLPEMWFERFQIPLVQINMYPDLIRSYPMMAYVFADGVKSMKNLLDMLYSQGHRNIVLLAPNGQAVEEMRARYQSFYKYLKSHRVQNPEQRCIFSMEANSFEKNLSLLKKAISGGATALIGVDEGFARNVLSLVEALKLNIPNRISLVCWERPEILPYFDPPVTGLSMDYKLMCETAVDLLAKLCRREKVSNVYLPFRLIERESVAPAYQRKTRGKLADRIVAQLANGPDSRSHIASVLGVKPYSGYFSRMILELLKSKRIVYGRKSISGKAHLLQLPERPPNGEMNHSML